MKIVGALIGVLGFAAVAHADDIKLGVPGYGGSGCPSNSVSATLSPDSKSLSLLFDEYIVQAGGDTGKSLIAAGNEWMARENVKRPDRMIAMLAPGFAD